MLQMEGFVTVSSTDCITVLVRRFRSCFPDFPLGPILLVSCVMDAPLCRRAMPHHVIRVLSTGCLSVQSPVRAEGDKSYIRIASREILTTLGLVSLIFTVAIHLMTD